MLSALGLRVIDSRNEHDNAFYSMRQWYVYHSQLSNTIYAGQTAAEAAHFEQENPGQAYRPANRSLY